MYDWLSKKPIQKFLICEYIYTEMKESDQQILVLFKTTSY